MKKLVPFALVVLLTSCTAVPIKRSFPAVPDTIQERCPDLALVSQDAQLSDIISVMIDNYALYHECQLKVDTWNQWYRTQKQIFEE